MMIGANIPPDRKWLLCSEAFLLATKLDWLIVVDIGRKNMTRVEHHQGELPDFATHLRAFGEAGTVKKGKEGKVGSRGVTIIFVGYAKSRRRFHANV